MRLPPQRWLKVVLFTTAGAFASVAVYLYALRFFAWAESDTAVTVLLAGKLLDARRPVVETWYYANGDVWFFAPQLLALLPVALLGIGPASLLVTVAAGFVLELIVVVREYARLCGERWIAVLAGLVTLMAWSPSHVMYVYIQLFYGFCTVVYIVLFGLVARLAERGTARRWTWLAIGGLTAVLAVQNPTRGLVFVVAPLLVACAWPWRGLARRLRLAIGAAVIAGWAVAYGVYALVFTRVVQFSVPRGHIDFAVANLAGIGDNLVRLARGVLLLCAGGTALGAAPGLIVVAGAVVLVVADALGSRALTPLRFICVVASVQLALVCVPLVIGNLLVSADSVRYAMPSLLTMFGLAAILAVRTITTATTATTAPVGWLRWLATGWLAAVPVAALTAMPGARPPVPVRYVWPNLTELDRIADELVHRKLTHGFANVLAANVLNLESRGATLACPVYFRELVMPQRWLADTSCYTAAAIPDQFYVVLDQGEHDEAALRATLPAPVERFRVGAAYEVAVFRTAGTAMPWLELPMADGNEARFPIEIAATHLQLRHREAIVDGSAVVATGKPGSVIYGPYIALPRGRYELVWFGRGLASPGVIAFSARAGGGAEIFAQVEVHAEDLPRTPGELTRVAFRLDRPRDALEFLVESGGGGRVELQRLVIRRR